MGLIGNLLLIREKDRIMNYLVGYCLINLFNLIAQTALLYLFVERLHMDEGSAKFVSWGMTILWNFFLYKFIVYV